MKQKKISYIYIFFLLLLFDGVCAQQFELKIKFKDKKDKVILENINFKKVHLGEVSIRKEVDAISKRLQKVGYFSNQLDSLVKRDSIYTSYYSLGKRIKRAIIYISSDMPEFTSKKKITLQIEELEFFLTTISNKLDRAGKSFSEVRLKNIRINNDELCGVVFVNPSKKRTIDKVIVKGYEGFSKSHLKHFLDLKIGSTFKQQKLKSASLAIKSLSFVEEIKPPEVLFSKDSTIVYVYLQKNKVNNFDGLISFVSNEKGGGLLFNGHVDLELNNVLHTGEQFALLWKANGQERQDFKISTRLPYIFNSAFSPELSFNIYRQDSSFLNTKFYGGLRYAVNPKFSFAFTYNLENSKNTLQKKNDDSVEDFDNSFFGLHFQYQVLANTSLFDNRFFLSLNPSLGLRNADAKKESQFKIDFEVSYLHQLSHRNSIFIRNKTGYLNSDTFLENELFRIGGANSIRGFNEYSIFTSQFSYFNIEYRYLTSQTSYLYSITDIGHVNNETLRKNIFGVGLGYLFNVNNTRLNVGYVIGKYQNQPFDFSRSKLVFSVKSFF